MHPFREEQAWLLLRGAPWGLAMLWNKEELQLIRADRCKTAAPIFSIAYRYPKQVQTPLPSGKRMLQAPNQFFSFIFLQVYFLAEGNISTFDFLGINRKTLKENLINPLCYRRHQVRHSLGHEVTKCRGEGNEKRPSNHACQLAWGQSVPINMNEDRRHSAPCMLKTKMKVASHQNCTAFPLPTRHVNLLWISCPWQLFPTELFWPPLLSFDGRVRRVHTS